MVRADLKSLYLWMMCRVPDVPFGEPEAPVCVASSEMSVD